MSAATPQIDWFRQARYGLFIHYGLYSLLGRGEWVLNREQIPLAEYQALADDFTAEKLDFDRLLGTAANEWGMTYANLTCKHHDGFCLYDSQLTDFTAPKTRCGRDLVGEFVEACRKHGLRISLYHSLNDWTHRPNAVDALNNPAENHEPFLEFVHGQIREIMSNYGPVDVMWYDGWWPFGPEGWQAETLNAMVRELQPGILVNGRCGLPGDFGTPEQHLTDTGDDRPFEACLTLNDNWGYHQGDHNWKSPAEVCELLRQCAALAKGNLLLNVGPRGDGSVPEASVEILETVGRWLRDNGEAIRETDPFIFTMHEPGPDERADWMHSGRFTARGNSFYYHVRHWPGETLALGCVRSRVKAVTHLASGESYRFTQTGRRVVVEDAPAEMETTTPVVLKFECEEPPVLYNCGGYEIPQVPHCRYDPIASDLPESV